MGQITDEVFTCEDWERVRKSPPTSDENLIAIKQRAAAMKGSDDPAIIEAREDITALLDEVHRLLWTR